MLCRPSISSHIRVYERLEADTIFVLLITFEVDFNEGDGLDVRPVNIDDAQTAVGATPFECAAGEFANFVGSIRFSAESLNRENAGNRNPREVKRVDGIGLECLKITFQRSETLQQLLEVLIKTGVIHVMH